MLSYTEIIKNSFLEEMSEFSALNAVFALTSSLIIGLCIYFIYKKTFKGVMYSTPFNTSLVMLCLLTTFVILAVTTNVVLSLGMVGALSIVRFRTAIKDPLDLVFLFWSIGVGIILGAGYYVLAYGGSFFIAAVLFVFTLHKEKELSYILMLDLKNETAEVAANDVLRKQINRLKLKSKTLVNGQPELIYEVKIKENDTAFMSELFATEGVLNASLVSYNGELNA
ncbi:DUF4956 domain-containing protein [Marinilactibacillus psychrotolerans]|uniref:DUF4956 domain-containing protein n=1 Tax=Marinilactibacillus psychrotolerans TaxID=191770 RepID=A0AAV3WQX2_9LACT|nr:DUF4956 domain-containing protein [Marinilactibacillus psychrotolerans]GEL66593.1 DUF4956 domain-containing protein [Marinilactibacillus psychrotolerans]GEQ35115.1 DUF4956 domain-containing protein [Marinilactibacillus psychrotolerans]SDC82128.1 protein of unknown function [Marinilactibacillus psychrotolerans]